MVIWLISGLWILVGCAEAAHLITLITDRSLQTYMNLCSVFCVAGILIIGAGCAVWCRKRQAWKHRRGHFRFSPYMAVFALIGIITVRHFVRGYVPDLEDAVYEMVLGNIKSGSIMTMHPFLGTDTGVYMPLRMQIPGLSSLYSALITISQQSPYMILCKVIPMAVWIAGMLVYYAFAEKLFQENIHKRWAFLSLAAGMLLLTGGSEGLEGFRLLYAGFSGETIRNVVLIPYTIYVCWQRKWPAALLGVAAEVCLVWTTYGVGYAACIAVCMFLLHLCLDRRNRHAA